MTALALSERDTQGRTRWLLADSFLISDHIILHRFGNFMRLYLCVVQVAVPYGITVDFDSLKAPHSVTLRERDSTTQIRLKLHDVTISIAPENLD